mmetsp:Transcript_17815/g.30197  ORF Transcript_17815/g.30197 Transcript_17815/m.30197 type:complete len:323 (-) Transcript_17815:117-1085(-)
MQVCVAGVFRVDGHADVSEHGLKPGGSHGDVLVRALHLVLEVGQSAELVLFVGIVAGNGQASRASQLNVLHLQVGESSLEGATPVDQSCGAVDEALLEHPHEGLGDSLGPLVVEGEGEAIPVDRDAVALELVVDLAAVLVLPLPHLLHELLSPEVVPSFSLLLPKHLLDHALGRDTSVVHAWQPERLEPVHPLLSRNDVLDGQHESVAQMECARHVGGRDDHHELLLVWILEDGLGVSLEVALLLPPGVPGGLDGLGVVLGEHGLGTVFLLSERSVVGHEGAHLLGLILLLFGGLAGVGLVLLILFVLGPHLGRGGTSSSLQ